MQVLYTLYTDSASKNLKLFLCSFFFSLSPLLYARPFCLYSNIRPAQLDSSYKRNQTLHLSACVCVCDKCVCVCVWMVYVHAYNVRRGLLLSVLQLIVKLMYIVHIALQHRHLLCSLKQTWYSP